MKKIQLGTTDLSIAPIVFGGNVFGWTVDEQRSFELLDAFTGAGFNMIDTADMYSRWAPGNKGGESETIIGKWMKDRNNRSEIIIATKGGNDMGDGKKGVTKKYILQAAEASLVRLQTDHIDLYQTHFDDEATPLDEALQAYDELVQAGKIRWIGTSNMSAERVKEALANSEQYQYPAYKTLQPQYNLLEREKFETQYEQLCVENNIGVLTYFSLASGFLSGKYRMKDDLAKSKRGGDMDKHFNKRGFAILASLDSIAVKHEATPAAIALAWLIARPSVSAPIASATSIQQLESFTKAAAIKLGDEDISTLTEASAW